jgi:putative thioredoxin
VVDFWADWCGPCKALGPALEKAEASREGKIVVAKVDVDAHPRLAALFKIQGIPAVKAFRHGKVVNEFTGALPPARVEAFFDSLLPSRADELLDAGDELSLREAAELEPGRAEIAVALAKARLERGAEDAAAFDRGDPETALDALLAEMETLLRGGHDETGLTRDELRDLLRRAIVGILSDTDPGDPMARAYRRKLSTVLG